MNDHEVLFHDSHDRDREFRAPLYARVYDCQYSLHGCVNAGAHGHAHGHGCAYADDCACRHRAGADAHVHAGVHVDADVYVGDPLALSRLLSMLDLAITTVGF